MNSSLEEPFTKTLVQRNARKPGCFNPIHSGPFGPCSPFVRAPCSSLPILWAQSRSSLATSGFPHFLSNFPADLSAPASPMGKQRDPAIEVWVLGPAGSNSRTLSAQFNSRDSQPSTAAGCQKEWHSLPPAGWGPSSTRRGHSLLKSRKHEFLATEFWLRRFGKRYRLAKGNVLKTIPPYPKP